jgi:hypothetical protein
MNRMHAARIETSPRLQRVLETLQRGGRWTTRELIETAHVCAVNSAVAELRANGYPITCERRKNVWLYWLERKQEVSA